MKGFRMKRVFCALVFIPLFLSARPKPRYSPTFYEPCEDVVTPHTTWAKPLAGGPLKVLFLTHRRAMREVVELAQRLEMEYTVFAQEGVNKFGETGKGVDASWRLIEGNSAEELGEELRGKLNAPYDLIVIGNIDWNTLPIDCRYLILKKVKEGTGLVGRIHGGRDQYIERLLETTDFAWHSYSWTGGAKGIPDYFGIGEFAYAVDAECGHESNSSVRITCTKATKGSKESPRGGFMPPKLPLLEPNTEYVFSVWSRTEGMGQGGASVSLHPQSGVSLPVGEEWTRTEHTFRTDDKKLNVGVYLLAYHPGTVWFDDVCLIKKGDTKNLLPNSGFEHPGPSPVALAEGIPFQVLPAFAKHKDKTAFLKHIFSTTVFAKGRIALVSYSVPDTQMLTPGAIGDVWDNRQDYDYYLAAAVRLMLWGARREQHLDFLDGPLQQVERAAAEKTILRVSASGASVLDATVRNRHGRVFRQIDVPVHGQDGHVEVGGLCSGLPRGTFFVDVRAKDSAGRVTGFGSAAFVVTAAQGIETFALEPGAVKSGQALTGTVTFADMPPGGRRLQLRAVDYYGRILATAVLPVTGKSVPFSLPMPPSLSLCGRLEADLTEGDQLLDTAVATYTITDRHPDPQNVQFVMWQSYGNDFISTMVAEQFTKAGVDAQYGGKWKAQSGPRANQWWLPYATRFVDTKTDWYQLKKTRQQDDLARSPCLTDPAYREEVRESLLKTANAAREVGTGDITLGDENHFVAGHWDLCFSDTCVADFRRWAQDSYGDLDALNASWGSHFKSWEEVRPRTLKECKAEGNAVPWIDHRLHMESVWAGIHDFSRDVIREVIPDARVGYEGSDVSISTWRAADFWKLSRAMNLNNIYYRDFVSQAWADFAEPGTLLGAGWFGGYAGNRNDVYMHYFPWRAIFKGGNSLWVWAGYGHAGAVMSFDTSLYPFFRTACDEVAELKNGPAKLLITAKHQHDGVALLYSASSVHVAEVIPDAPKPESVLNSWVRILNDLGIASRIVSYEQLAKGSVRAPEFRALVLPCAWAMSMQECNAVKAFAAEGGAVLADLLPARTDQHGKPFDVSPLAGVFGVVPTGPFSKQMKALADVEGIGDASVEGAGLHSGNAQLLNVSLDSYVSQPAPEDTDFAGWEDGETFRTLVQQVLAEAGVTAPVTVHPPQPRVEISRFRRNECEYIAVLQALPRKPIEYTLKTASIPKATPVTIHFPRKARIYDVRRGNYMGHMDSLEMNLTPGIAQLYALLPGKGGRIKVDAPRKAAPGGMVTVKASLAADEGKLDRVVHLRVLDPTGREYAHYSQSQLTVQGKTNFTIPFALNDPVGKWKVIVHDVATGAADSDSIRLMD